MDDSRFDALSRSLTLAGSRRGALGGLLAGTLGILGWHDGDESAAHNLKAKCKKKSGDAKKKCLKKAKKHNAQHRAETSPPPPPPPPGPCAGRPDNQTCNGTGRCLDGVCNPQPQCVGFPLLCVNSGNLPCCSGSCMSSQQCARSDVGGLCRVNQDCNSDSCIGYRCVHGTKLEGETCGFYGGDQQCASDQCGCSEALNTCTCRRSSCSGPGATCNTANGHLDCCEGQCTVQASGPPDKCQNL